MSVALKSSSNLCPPFLLFSLLYFLLPLPFFPQKLKWPSDLKLAWPQKQSQGQRSTDREGNFKTEVGRKQGLDPERWNDLPRIRDGRVAESRVKDKTSDSWPTTCSTVLHPPMWLLPVTVSGHSSSEILLYHTIPLLTIPYRMVPWVYLPLAPLGTLSWIKVTLASARFWD